jgi:hypothetical protein
LGIFPYLPEEGTLKNFDHKNKRQPNGDRSDMKKPGGFCRNMKASQLLSKRDRQDPKSRAYELYDWLYRLQLSFYELKAEVVRLHKISMSIRDFFKLNIGFPFGSPIITGTHR